MRLARANMWAVYDRYNGNLFMIAADHDSIFTSERAARHWIKQNNLQRLARVAQYTFKGFRGKW